MLNDETCWHLRDKAIADREGVTVIVPAMAGATWWVEVPWPVLWDALSRSQHPLPPPRLFVDRWLEVGGRRCNYAVHNDASIILHLTSHQGAPSLSLAFSLEQCTLSWARDVLEQLARRTPSPS